MISNKEVYSCLPESRIISSFKRFIDEKKKNSFPSQQPILTDPSAAQGTQGQGGQAAQGAQGLTLRFKDPLPEPTNSSITYQSQIISCYYSLTEEEQNNFWNQLVSGPEKETLQNLDGEAFYLAILDEITKFFQIQRDSPNLEPFLMNKILYAYNDCGDRIYFTKILRFDDEQHVGIGVLTKDYRAMCTSTDEEWVVKWNVREDVGRVLTDSEIEKWKVIENNGTQIPKVVSGFKILDFPVVVMEKLSPLEPNDYNQKLIVSIVNYIERILPIGVNNNLKPSNILKRVDKNETTYLVADITMMTTKEKDYGYQRFSWSPSWTSQVVDLDTITTVKNDLLEFGYVLVWLSQGDEILNKEKSDEIITNVRVLPRNEEVSKWIERVKTINEQDIKMNDFIDLKKLAIVFPRIERTYDLCTK
jgi:hypothetical protein